VPPGDLVVGGSAIVSPSVWWLSMFTGCPTDFGHTQFN